MSITNNYPDFNVFWKNEFKTLEYLKNRTLLKDYSELATSIEQSYLEYFATNKHDKINDFKFHCKFTMEIEKHFHEVIIGANVLVNYMECSYFLAIGGTGADEKKLIRKFHFDYAIPQNLTKQNVPVFHLQYGGQISPLTGKDGFDGDKLDTWLSLPRLNFFPVNLAILLDTMFCEFRTIDTNKIVQDNDWRTLIYNNERLLTQHYFNNIYNHLNGQNHKKDHLLRDFCYGFH